MDKEKDRINLDAFDWRLSNSKNYSEALSFDKEDGLNVPALNKSLVNDRGQGTPFFFSLEMESSKDLAPNPLLTNSPPRSGSKSFLSKFAQRFDSLRKIAVEEEGLKNSLALSAFRQEAIIAEAPQLQSNEKEKKCTSSKVNGSQPSLDEHSSNERRFKAAPLNSSGFVLFCSNSDQPPRPASPVKLPPPPPPTPRRRIMFKHLQNVYELFHNLFSKGMLEPSEYQLADWEEEVIGCLIHRKYFCKLTAAELQSSSEEKVRRVNEILSSRSNKRPEECYKFILTRVIRYLKRTFPGAEELSGASPSEQERAFYRYYFADLTTVTGLPLEAFYYPISRKQQDKLKLNANYFDKIFRSERFMKDTLSYVEAILREEYKVELKQKLKSLLSKYDLMIKRKTRPREDVLKLLKDYLLKNKRCKLPWTVREINEAVERFYILLDHFKNPAKHTMSLHSN